MEVHIRGKQGKIRLTQNDFLTKGGEASIFIRQGIVFKIYHDPSKMIKEAKIQELDALKISSIIRPLDIIINSKNMPIGFTMTEIKNTIALCKLFTNDFWNRNNINFDVINVIVDSIKSGISFIHEHDGYLIVDGNEFNYIISENFSSPFFIDVDSYQTPSFPATAIMPSIRDYHSKTFTKLTDWFSFGIVAFQLFTGIHPFKGRHPDFKRNDLEGRMLANASVFDKNISLPSAVRDIKTSIPKNYRNWFLEVFQNGERSIPPDKAGDIISIVVPAIIIGSTKDFIIKELYKFKSNILYYNCDNGIEKVKLANNEILINKKSYKSIDGEIVFSPKSRSPYVVKIINNNLSIQNIDTKKEITQHAIFAESMMIINDHIYIKSTDKIVELSINENSSTRTCIPFVKSTFNVLPNATIIFSNVIYQNILGVPCFNIPEPTDSGISKMFTVLFKEISEHKIIDAKYLNRILILTTHKDNLYHRIIIRFSEDHKEYDLREINDVVYSGINFTVNSMGITAIINPDDSLEAILNIPNNNKVKKFENVDSNMKLYSDLNKIIFTKGNKLFSLSIK